MTWPDGPGGTAGKPSEMVVTDLDREHWAFRPLGKPEVPASREGRNLPGFVVLGNNRGSKGGPLNWSSGFLPSTYQGTPYRAEGTPILNPSGRART